MRYRGIYIHTIKREDVHKLKWDNAKLWTGIIRALGRIMPCDIGKRVYCINGVYQVESSEQRDKRLNESQ